MPLFNANLGTWKFARIFAFAFCVFGNADHHVQFDIGGPRKVHSMIRWSQHQWVVPIKHHGLCFVLRIHTQWPNGMYLMHWKSSGKTTYDTKCLATKKHHRFHRFLRRLQLPICPTFWSRHGTQKHGLESCLAQFIWHDANLWRDGS